MLKARLRKLVDCINDENVVADIGCDHGFVCKALLDENRAKKIIACDVSKHSLKKAQILLQDYKNVATITCDGLYGLKEKEADVIIIAGMGGHLITEILNSNISIAKSAKRLILLPHNNEHVLREFLSNNGFYIYDEHVVLEDRYYEIICAKAGESDYKKEVYYYIGKRLFEKNEKEFIEFKREKFLEIAAKAKKGKYTAQKAIFFTAMEEEICKLAK